MQTLPLGTIVAREGATPEFVFRPVAAMHPGGEIDYAKSELQIAHEARRAAEARSRAMDAARISRAAQRQYPVLTSLAALSGADVGAAFERQSAAFIAGGMLRPGDEPAVREQLIHAANRQMHAGYDHATLCRALARSGTKIAGVYAAMCASGATATGIAATRLIDVSAGLPGHLDRGALAGMMISGAVTAVAVVATVRATAELVGRYCEAYRANARSTTAERIRQGLEESVETA